MLLYRLLLLLYPRTFRQRYGAAMLATLADRGADARRAGAPRLLRFHVAAVRDLLVSAIAERLLERRPFVTSVLHDLKYALRMVWRRPALSFFSATTLALGIGAVAAVTALVDAVFVQPLPYPHPHQIVFVRAEIDERAAGMSYENLVDIRERAASIAAASPFLAQSVNLTGVAEPERLRGGFVTSGFFDVVAVVPALGATFGRSADVPGAERVAVLTDRAWKVRFGARPDIVGTRLQLNNAPFTVIGVLPSSFTFPLDDVEVFIPFWTTATGTSRGNHNYIGIARLQPWATRDSATQEVRAIAASLERAYPEVNRGLTARVESFRDALVEDMRYPLQLVIVMITIALVAVCANVAGLHLGETVNRRREIAVRTALGAGRIRIVRQLVLESVARAMAGALLGVAAARWAIAYVVANTPAGIYGVDNARLNPVVIGVAMLAALCAGVAAGLPPAVRWARARTLALPGSDARVAGDTFTSHLRSSLVVCQIGLASVLLVIAGLATRSLSQLTAVDVGFQAPGLLTVEYRLPENKYRTDTAQVAFHARVIDQIRGVPGVVDAAAVRALPFSGNGNTSSFRLAKDAEALRASMNAVSDRYFETMRIPLLAGRVFLAGESSEPVVVVSHTLAQRAWPRQNPIGRTVYFDDADITARVVGVVGDVRHRDLAESDIGTIYTFQNQNPSLFNTLTVRTAGRPMDLADDVRRAVWRVDPDQPVWKIRTADSLIARAVAPRRFLQQLMAFFGVSAACLAVLGLYGVVAAAVAQRRREIGVRVALGASSASVLSLVFRRGLRLASVGITVGMAAAVAAAQLMRGFLFGVSPGDPLTFGAAIILLLAAAVLACAIPAVRALRVNPVVVLRET